jgi:RHS repeat-associated protein
MAFANPIVLSSPLSSIPIIYRERQYRYDPKYQLKSEMLWSAKVPGARSDALLWTYDGNGNRLTQHDDGILTDYVYGSNNEMTDAGSDAFTFDNFGNTASIVGVETYSYDFESHMTVREASGGSTDTHEYDGDGRRMRSKLNDAADWTHFIHDELTENLICEYTLISGSFAIKALNTYGLGLISSNRQGTIRYFHFDGLGTTHHLTDSSQSVTDSYAFDAFGVPSSATGSSINPYRYVGQWGYYDDGAMGSSSEMLLLGARYYWPKYGRFTVWDPVPGSNAYLYCDNRSTRAADSSGMQYVEDPIAKYFRDFRIPWPWTNPACEERVQLPFNCYSCLHKLYDKYGRIYHGSQGINNALRHCVGACAARRQCGEACAWAIFGH